MRIPLSGNGFQTKLEEADVGERQESDVTAGVPEELRKAAEFHTHLGPFLVVGLRMGRVVTRELGRRPFTIRIEARTGPVPPYSCLVDGLQVSTPCTIGNGGLAVPNPVR